jgi:hypothetical protein
MHDDTAQLAVDTFIAAFNAPSPEVTAQLLPMAFHPDVTFWGPLGRTAGLVCFEEFVNNLRGHPRGPGRFTRTTAVDAPGEWARYGWAYHDAEGGLALEGVDVVHLRDGRIDHMVVFGGELGPGE